MFAGNTRNLPYIRSYYEAHDFFNKTKKPPRSKKWGDHQRPLKNVSAYHYRIEHSPETNAYSLWLYNTEMARFYPPAHDGSERRCYVMVDTTTSKSFMRNVANMSYFNSGHSTDGRHVIVPVVSSGSPAVFEHFTADLVYVLGRLDTAQSKHTPIFKRVSSETDKTGRKQVKQRFEPIFNTIEFLLPQFEQECEATWSAAGSEPHSLGVRYAHKKATKDLVTAFQTDKLPDAESVSTFMQIARMLYLGLISVRAVAEKKLTWTTHTSVNPTDLDKPVTAKELISALWRYVQKETGLDRSSGTVPYPMFPEPDQITLSNVTAFPR